MIDLLPLVLFVVVCLFLMAGYPVALTMAGVSLLFAGLRSEEHTSELQSPS